MLGAKVVAFAGIGRPQKFFDSLQACGARLVARHGFPDHYPYRPSDIAALQRQAEALDALLVTTEKDMVKIAPFLTALRARPAAARGAAGRARRGGSRRPASDAARRADEIPRRRAHLWPGQSVALKPGIYQEKRLKPVDCRHNQMFRITLDSQPFSGNSPSWRNLSSFASGPA